MDQTIPEQLKLLSDKIQDEEMSYIINKMAEAIICNEEKQPSTTDLRKETEREKCACLLLRSLRIHLCLDLIRQGHSSCIGQFRQDWEEIIECMKFMEYKSKITGEILSDAVDVILLLEPDKRNALLRLLDFSTRMKIKSRKPLRPYVVDCAFQMAHYCFKTERGREMIQIIDNLIALSQERNAGDLDKHRIVTTSGLYYLADNDPQLTIRICDAQKRYYNGITDKWACRFWWYYACSLLQSERREEAVSMLKQCHDLYMDVEGERSWIGARAGALWHQHMLSKTNAAGSESYLWDLLKKIDSGFYQKVDHTADFVATTTRSALLRHRQDHQRLRGLLPDIQRFLKDCAEKEELFRHTELTVRHAENILASYYLETGDYLLAADHTLNALASEPPEGMPKFPTDVLLYSNLLLVYINLNNTEQIIHYTQKLMDLSAEYMDDKYTATRIDALFNTARKKLMLEMNGEDSDFDELEEIRREIHSFHRSIRSHQFEPFDSIYDNMGFAQRMMDLCSSILDTFSADRKELLRIRQILTYFLDRPNIYKLSDVQKCTLYAFLAHAEWQLGSDRALAYLQKCLSYAGSLAPSREVRITILRFVAVVYYNFHRLRDSRAVVDEALSGVTSAWQKATAYLNDKRVCQVLNFIQRDFDLCFALLRTCTSDEELYERVLQFKDLPALVGRERNKILRLAPVDERLKQQIYEKQDQLAAAELNDALNETNTAQEIAAQLEHLEAHFASQFPQDLFFTNISFRGVCEKLPDHSAIVEYFFAYNDTVLSGPPCNSDALELDIFITSKRSGTTQLKHLKLERGDLILAEAENFTRMLQKEDDSSGTRAKERLRIELHRKLLAPVLPYLDGITSLYIAPDDQLCNLPFEILHADGSGILQDSFQVCRLVCGRDLLFFDDHTPSGGNCFILGDPDYESEQGEISHSFVRSSKISLMPFDDLPFSGIEAARVGRHCRSRIYSGPAATKYALQDALPCSLIHLATHGVFDEEMETDSLYSSHLIFAGYNKWVTRKTESRCCGNGLLTADEISRMDLHKTEMVVLSACQSGLGDTSYRSAKGLLSAFSAAGARWIVSHMWRANDFTTAILMDVFYDALMNKGYDVPDALQYAKDYLKNVSIGTLRQTGWLELPDNGRFSEDIIKEIEYMQTLPDSTELFRNEYFWGGFTVHKSR